jgi:hypothetical protein
MKNQYFGDFGDYQKFSLLKMLRNVGGFKITVHWMKTRDDGGTDGKRVTYLNNPKTWDSFDKEIFEFISGHIHAKKRDLALYEKSLHADGITFVNDHIESAQRRLELLDGIRSDKKSDLIFFDPDNGIEVKSTTQKTIHKYVLWSDIQTAFSSGKSILVYQHFSRKNRDIFIQEKLTEFRSRLDVDVFVIKVKHSVYFLLAQKSHISRVRQSLIDYSKVWKSLVSTRDPQSSKQAIGKSSEKTYTG